MNDVIGYLRVSTKEQGRSGLGLAAQRHEIEAFGARGLGSVCCKYDDEPKRPVREGHRLEDLHRIPAALTPRRSRQALVSFAYGALTKMALP